MSRLGAIVAVLLLPTVICNLRVRRVVGGEVADLPPEDDPVVFVYKDGHDARVYGKREEPGGYYSFKGIRFAEPPVGRFRFQRARRLRLDGDINATLSGPPCPQQAAGSSAVVGDEDCLCLNVFTSELADGSDGLPVLVWIHGGGFRRGSASQYGARHLVDKKLVVVVIQYRLGSLGFFGTGSPEQPGNVGLFDMSLALDWVKDYVSYFGGDPNKITVSGQDTGATSAILLSMSNINKGSISGVIAMSGSALSPFAVDTEPTVTTTELANQNSCPSSPVLDMVRCLQDLPVEQLITADSNLQGNRLAAKGIVTGLASLLSASPVVEGKDDLRFLPNFLAKPPLDFLNGGLISDIPLLTGVTKEETSTALTGGLRKEIEFRIQSIPGFLDSVVTNLVANTASSIANRTVDIALQISSSYFQLIPQLAEGTNKLNEALNKIIEASGDALFNLPAFQTAQLWKGKAFFYSFDHKGTKKGGPMFLGDSPLTNQTGATDEPNTGVGHGDDLLYLFDPLTLDGTRGQYAELDDPIDVRVRDDTTSMIAEFARNGVPKIKSQGETPWPIFRQGSNDFVSISAKPKTESNFRYCQMALWAELSDSLQSVKCQSFGGLESIGGVLGAGQVVPSTGQIGQPLNTVTGPLQGGSKSLQGANLPLGSNGPLQGSNGPLQGSNGPLQGSNGPLQGSNASQQRADSSAGQAPATNGLLSALGSDARPNKKQTTTTKKPRRGGNNLGLPFGV